MAALDDYLALITSWHRGKPRFTATVSATLAPFAEGQAVLAGLSAAFDLDSAVGAQLDIDGEWIGATRFVPRPIKGLYFAFDDPARGLDVGVWRGPYDVSIGTYRLDDTTYRRLLKAQALANRWDGSLDAAQTILDTYFVDPATQVRIVDTTSSSQPLNIFAFDRPGRGFDEAVWQVNLFAFDSDQNGFDEARWLLPLEDDDARDSLDMGLAITVSGQIPGLIDLSILGRQLIPIKPAGVAVDVVVTSISGAPLFGFDVQNSNVGGFDRGAWGASPDYLADRAL